MVGTGRGATAGVLVKNAEALEILEKVNVLIVDKTGTLTEGKPKLVSVIAKGIDEKEFLQLAASLERNSEHPLAESIVAGAEERKVELLPVENFESITGKGVTGQVGGKQVALGNLKLLEHISVKADADLESQADKLRTEGQTVMFVSVDGQHVGIVGVSDPIKESAAEAIRMLHEAGVEIVMLTGDNPVTANAVAKQLGLDKVQAEVLPEQKGEIVKQYQAERQGRRYGRRRRQ